MWAESEEGFSYKASSRKWNIRQRPTLTYSSWSRNDLGSVRSQTRKSVRRAACGSLETPARLGRFGRQTERACRQREGGLDLGRGGGYWSRRSGSSGVAGPHLKDEGYLPSPLSVGVSLYISPFIYLSFSRILSPMMTGRAGEKRKQKNRVSL